MKKALRLGGDTHSVADVVEALKKGEMQGFWSENAGIITQVIQHPRKKELNVFLAFGDLDEVMDNLHPQIVEFGRQHGCSFVVMSGRDGWRKVLPRYGWTKVGVAHALPLEK